MCALCDLVIEKLVSLIHLDGNNTKVRVRVATHFQGITNLLSRFHFGGASLPLNNITSHTVLLLFFCA